MCLEASMRVDPHPNAVCGPNITYLASIVTRQGQQLILDQTAKLEVGCTVAVFLKGSCMPVVRLLRRPLPHPRLVIGYRDAHGNQGITRIFGLRSEDIKVWRLKQVLRDI